MELHPDVQRTRYLPAVSGEGFELGPREPLAVGLRRISVEQCDLALDGLRGPTTDIAAGIHEARKAMKRIRAILRLVRPRLGDRIYRFENRTLRDTARLVAPVRDAIVTVETVTTLASRFDGALGDHTFHALGERLESRASRIRKSLLEEGDAVDRVITILERTRSRFAGWAVEEAEGRAYGSSIPDRFRSVGMGLTDTYRRGRQEMRQAYASPSTARFHLWRKRVKYLRHQLEVLEPLWPEVIGGAARASSRLGDLLGDEHDLADLLSLLAVDPDLCRDPVERSLLAALAQHRRAELRASAAIVGSKVYAEKPSRFARRVEAYWDASWLPADVGLDIEV